MKNPLVKKSVILNAEGDILGLYEDPKGQLFFKSFLKNNIGNVYYDITEAGLQHFLNSEVSLKELFLKATLTRHEQNKKSHFEAPTKSFIAENIQCGEQLFEQIENGLKSRSFLNSI